MRFVDPDRLWLLLGVAVVAVGYVFAQRRRGRYAIRFSDTSLLDSVAPHHPGFRRHVVAALFLAVASVMILAVAGPARTERIPREHATVVLTIDTSLSMGATDVNPSRIDAAKKAALTFLDKAPKTLDIGLVSYNGVPVVRVVPTRDRAVVAASIRSLQLGESTATGDAIFASLDAIKAAPDATPINPGSGEHPAAMIVLLSDGTPTVGRSVSSAVAAANQAGVPISTVSLGTANGRVTINDPNSPGNKITVDVPVDEKTLSDIAKATGGKFFTATSTDEVASVYDDIGTTIGFETVDRDITDWFIGGALALAAITALFSLAWFQRLP